ncbi:VWA domain-containing protein [Marinobacter lacisalsi]|uniref:VWA domain-containing protein n=1 Tax=Marinobacter lacisalsi TaxID=475979 RepID=A0ABV8QNA3_9GAMM
MAMRKLLFTLTLLVTMTLSPAQAQDGQSKPARDVRVVVDISGSMKVNDPDNLRRPAVRLIARLLPDDTGVGLWTFGSMVNMLVPHDSLDNDLRARLIDGSEDINSVAQRTNIGGAIEEAASDWYAPDRSLANTHLILLSDGKVDISANQARNDRERDRILDDLVPALADQGLTIHTIALSGEADLDLLGAIADMTGGVARVADSAEELSRIFADTLGQAVPANEVPLENNRFTVDGGVEEFTALIFSATSPDKRELTLIGPDGSRYRASGASDKVRWARESGYDLITIDQPAAGEWQLEGVLGEGSRVTVVSDLRLEVEPMPARFQLGDEADLKAFFTEEGERITDPDFLGVITVRLSMTTEDGRRGTRILSEGEPPADGVYQDTISRLPEPGQYLLELEADGGTFSRKFRKTLVLEAPEGEPTTTGGTEIPLAPETAEEPEEPISEPEPPAGPVDLSQLEEPEPEPAAVSEPEVEASPAPEQAEPSLTDRLLAWWPWAAGVVGLLMLGAVALVLLKRRGGQKEEPAEEGEEISPRPAEQSPAESAEATPTEADAEKDTPTGVTGPEMETDSIMEPEEPPPEMEPDDEEPEPTPAAGDVPEPEEAPAEDTTDEPPVEPEQEQPAEQVSPDQDPGIPDPDSLDTDDSLPDDDDEEFGLEDFDLSDIDDLPDLENEEEDEERGKPSSDGRKKNE